MAASMKLVVDTTKPGSASDTFVLPLDNGSTYDFTIDWGEGGPTETITNATPGFPDISHTYASGGTYTIDITENVVEGFPTVYFNGGGDCAKLTELSQWGDNTWMTMAHSFDGCTSFTITAIDSETAKTGSVTAFDYAWYNCSALTTFPTIDTSSGTTFESAWSGCISLSSFPALSTSNGTTFISSWKDCSSLTSFPEIDVSSGTNFTSAWSGCFGLTSFPEIDVSSGTDFTSAWSGCSSLTSFPLITTTSGTNFSSAWYGCSSLASFPDIDISNGVNFSNAWNGCSSLMSFPAINTYSGTSFSYAWYDCYALTSFPEIGTSNGTDFSYAWKNCIGLTSFPRIDTANGTNFEGTWSCCIALTSFPDIDVSNGTNFKETWSYCLGLRGYDFPLLNMEKITDGTDCFKYVCLSTTSYTNLLRDLENAVNDSVTFDGGLSCYYSTAEAARQSLLDRSWTITDGGFSPASWKIVADRDYGAVPHTINFVLENLEYPPVAVRWDFGDGSTGAVLNPTHEYTTKGLHSLSVHVVYGDGHGETAFSPDRVRLVDMDFYVNPQEGRAPLGVLFEDRTQGYTGLVIYDHRWDFGDGYSAETGLGVTHMYMTDGVYSATMQAKLRDVS